MVCCDFPRPFIDPIFTFAALLSRQGSMGGGSVARQLRDGTQEATTNAFSYAHCLYHARTGREADNKFSGYFGQV